MGISDQENALWSLAMDRRQMNSGLVLFGETAEAREARHNSAEPASDNMIVMRELSPEENVFINKIRGNGEQFSLLSSIIIKTTFTTMDISGHKAWPVMQKSLSQACPELSSPSLVPPV